MRVVFVCLGNICRSPMAQSVFTRMVEDAGLADSISVDSCGTGAYHEGESPHSGTLLILAEHGIEHHGVARRIEARDLSADYVVCMDRENEQAVKDLGGNAHLLLDFMDADVRDVPDPYYTNTFSEVYELIEAGCHGFLEMIREEHEL